MAGLLLYSMQLALQNVSKVTFGQAKAEKPVTETVDAEKALREKALSEKAFSNQQSAVSQNQNQPQHQRPFTAKDAEPPQQAKTGLAGDPGDAKESKQNQHQNQRPFTTEGTGYTEEEKGVTQLDADERGSEVEIQPVEWKPTPDMYRMDTQEGREAYEASFRMKVRTSGDREATPPRAAVPHEHAQTHANVG